MEKDLLLHCASSYGVIFQITSNRGCLKEAIPLAKSAWEAHTGECYDQNP